MKYILIAEDHPLVLIGIEHLLRSYMHDVEILRADDFPRTLNMLEKHHFDLLIMDINIPEGDKVGMIDSVRRKQPDVPILICSSYDEKLYALPFLKAGANGYISKTAPSEEFKLAVASVMNKQMYASLSLFQSAFEQLINSKKHDASVINKLSEKELEIARLLSEGYSTKAIGERINLSAGSVSNYKTKIFEKLGVNNIIDLKTHFDLNN